MKIYKDVQQALALRDPQLNESHIVAAPAPTPSEAAALSLTLAVVEASPGPLLLLDGDLTIIAASRSFGEAFELDLATARGREVGELGAGEWSSPVLTAMLTAAMSGGTSTQDCELALRRDGLADRRLVVHAERLDYLDLENVRITVAVTDVTDAGADRLAMAAAEQHNRVLLGEVRHRVANSLQIVASLLLQDSRKAQSEDAKARLKEAHHRVMSVAALERQLAGGGSENIEVRGYVTTLCETIAASMIADREQIAIVVTGTGGEVGSRMSLNLGLIVTELVVNALKHAFPHSRHGVITIECNFPGPNWSLTVSDNGVGVPTDRRDARTGLGTNIVNALAKELGAAVEIGSAYPGARVKIARTAIALVKEDSAEAAASVPNRPAA
jgi:two-component sensor histidine kinase